MKISKFVVTITVLAGITNLTLARSAMSNVESKNTTADVLNKDRFLKQDDSGKTENEAVKTDLVSQTTTLKQRSPVFYLKEGVSDRDVLDLQNLTMGIAEEGEVVTIIDRQESMVKVQFNSTDRIGWVSQRVLSGL